MTKLNICINKSQEDIDRNLNNFIANIMPNNDDEDDDLTPFDLLEELNDKIDVLAKMIISNDTTEKLNLYHKNF